MKLNSSSGQVNFVKYIPGGVSLLKKLQLDASDFYANEKKGNHGRGQFEKRGVTVRQAIKFLTLSCPISVTFIEFYIGRSHAAIMQ